MLKRYRLAAELTQEDLAARAGLSVRGISNLERGIRAGPQEETLRRLVDAMQLAPDDRERLILAAHRGRVRRPRSAGETAPNGGLPPLVGREAELAALERHLLGEGPPMLALAGEPGIGKSRLLQEAAERAAAGRLTVLQGGGSRRSGQEPYSPFPETLARFLARVSGAQRRRALDGCEWLVRLLPELVPAPVSPAPLNAGQERRLVFAAVARFLQNVADRRGTVLVLDDLQWAGAGALDLLTSLLADGESGSIRVVGGYRDTDVEGDHPLNSVLAELGEQELIRQIHLSPLDREEASALLDELLPGDTEEADREAILQRAGGVPFFLVSCAHALGREPGHIPWNLAQSVRQRVAALSPSAQEMLEAAAIVGRVVPRSVLLAMLDRSVDRGLLDVDQACRVRLLVVEGEQAYRFAHDVVREVIEEDLGAGRRMLLHRRAAEALARLGEHVDGRHGATEIAWHFAQGDDPGSALPWTLRAGHRAEEAFAWEEAERQFRLALDQARRLAPTGWRQATEAEALRELGRVLHVTTRYDEALEPLEKAAATFHSLDDPDGEAEAVTDIGQLHFVRGSLDEGLARVRPALESLQGRASPQTFGRLYHPLTELLLLTGQFPELHRRAEEWLALSRTLEDKVMLANALSIYGTVLMTAGRVEEGVGQYEAAVAAAEESGNPFVLYEALSDMSIILHTGQLERALDYARRALALCEQTRANPVRRLKLLAEPLILLGNWPEARLHLDRALALERPGESIYAISPLRVLGQLCILKGDWDQAREHLTTSLTLAEETGEPFAVHAAQGFLAALDLRCGRPGDALDRLQPLLDGLSDQYEEHDLAVYLPIAPEAHLALGDVGAAQELVERIVARNRARCQRLALVHALRVQGMVCGRRERWQEAERAFEESLSLARQMRYPYAEAQALYEYGMMQAGMDFVGVGRDLRLRDRPLRGVHEEPGTGDMLLRAALGIFRLLGAMKDVERTQHALHELE